MTRFWPVKRGSPTRRCCSTNSKTPDVKIHGIQTQQEMQKRYMYHIKTQKTQINETNWQICRRRTAICHASSKWCGYPDYMRTTLPLFWSHRGRLKLHLFEFRINHYYLQQIKTTMFTFIHKTPFKYLLRIKVRLGFHSYTKEFFTMRKIMKGKLAPLDRTTVRNFTVN